MAFVKLGSKPEPFHREGQTWQCNSGLQSDVTIEIGEMSFHLHKFPLLSRSSQLEKLIGEAAFTDGSVSILQLNHLPGGAKAFELIAKFCYGVRIELTSMNVVSLRCASEYLQMTEEYGEGNMIAQTESFLNDVLCNWTDTIKALETCEEVLPHAEELHIVSRCINSLATKACVCIDPILSSTCPVSETGQMAAFWNGISSSISSSSSKPPPQPMSEDWWYEDVSFLSLPLYKRLIQAVEAGGMKAENISGALVFYVKKYIPQMNRQSSFKNLCSVSGSTISIPSEADQGAMLEEIVELLPNLKGVVHSRFLLRLLRTAMILQTKQSCRDNLERRVGLQLDEAALEDLLIPNTGYSAETLYDIECFQRILDHFMYVEHASNVVYPSPSSPSPSPCIVEEERQQLLEGAQHSLTSLTIVANLVDTYLAEVAPDVNLKFPKFQALAAAVPDYARPIADGIYRAVDIYLKAHPWLTDSEREQICKMINCQKLSLDASTHAAQNERLPLRVIVQVLFFEQLRLRTSISGWFFVSDNLDNSQNPDSVLALPLEKHDGCCLERDISMESGGGSIQEMREKVCQLEKECRNIKEEFHRLVKTKRSWNNIFCRRNSHHYNPKSNKTCNAKTKPACTNGNHQNKHKANGS